MKSFYVVVNGAEIHFEAESLEDAIMIAADTQISPPLSVFEKAALSTPAQQGAIDDVLAIENELKDILCTCGEDNKCTPRGTVSWVFKELKERGLLGNAQRGKNQFAPYMQNIENVLVGCANILDAIKPEWKPTNDWSEWDQSVRDGITNELRKLQSVQPVAWRVKDFADGWILFADEKRAREEVAASGAIIEQLYNTAPSEAPQDKGWQPIETAPKTGKRLLGKLADGYVCFIIHEYGEWCIVNNGDYIDGGYGRNYRTKALDKHSDYEPIMYWMPLDATAEARDGGAE